MATRALRTRLPAGIILTGAASLTLIAGPAAQQKPAPPDFSSKLVGWVTGNGEFVAVPGEPSPVRNDPAHPRISNAEAARTHKQPSYRIGDLSNPNLKPWVVERMKKDNTEVLAGKKVKLVHYKVLRNSWFVVSGTDASGQDGFYEKGVKSINGGVDIMTISYPENDSPLSEETLTQMSKTFTGNPGDD